MVCITVSTASPRSLCAASIAATADPNPRSVHTSALQWITADVSDFQGVGTRVGGFEMECPGPISTFSVGTTWAASKSPQSSANSRIQFSDNTRSGGERADVGGHDEGAPAELRIQRASRRDARSDHCGVYAGHLRIFRQALEAPTRCIREVSRSAGTNCGAWMRGTGIPVLRDMRSTVADSLAA